MNSFSDFGLAAPIASALVAEGHHIPTPIQAMAIPHVMAGRDLLAIAQTGTGKTAAFALPILHRLATEKRPVPPRGCLVLVVSPTRELANQILERFQAYGGLLAPRTAIAIGGVPIGRQIRALSRGVDILVGTPGRLKDLEDQRALRLDAVEVFVLDEADRMLDMGFIRDIRAIAAKLPARRQNLFFSATMPREIAGLASKLLTNPAEVSASPKATTAERIEQHVIFADGSAKPTALARLLSGAEVGRALVFARTKRGADRVAKGLAQAGIAADAIHGNKSQPQRERALEGFRQGRPRVLVATDIAARGIDVESITHVINFDMPNVPETYVHRIGRTGRAGATGIAVSLCASDERAHLRQIEKLIRRPVPVMALGTGEVATMPRAAAVPPAGGKARPSPAGAPTGRGAAASPISALSQGDHAQATPGGHGHRPERSDFGKGRAARIRRNGHRGAARRELSRQAG